MYDQEIAGLELTLDKIKQQIDIPYFNIGVFDEPMLHQVVLDFSKAIPFEKLHTVITYETWWDMFKDTYFRDWMYKFAKKPRVKTLSLRAYYPKVSLPRHAKCGWIRELP